ncbi:hypothetical protein PPACK8108_LOCUS2673 [Phakopsora pachyrhizi]|uniref:Uncharacterized protein n=1 Tax=Phakopsora pachyrhizi TaxID=170000 RepID=A0AAV0AMB3_PHAPC|nr:hypothetical protein PPACK8108_LOCUS2673 [Phakopsora pachyrhizi]
MAPRTTQIFRANKAGRDLGEILLDQSKSELGELKQKGLTRAKEVFLINHSFEELEGGQRIFADLLIKSEPPDERTHLISNLSNSYDETNGNSIQYGEGDLSNDNQSTDPEPSSRIRKQNSSFKTITTKMEKMEFEDLKRLLGVYILDNVRNNSTWDRSIDNGFTTLGAQLGVQSVVSHQDHLWFNLELETEELAEEEFTRWVSFAGGYGYDRWWLEMSPIHRWSYQLPFINHFKTIHTGPLVSLISHGGLSVGLSLMDSL